jgi:hypothetical protein
MTSTKRFVFEKRLNLNLKAEWRFFTVHTSSLQGASGLAATPGSCLIIEVWREIVAQVTSENRAVSVYRASLRRAPRLVQRPPFEKEQETYVGNG